MARAKFDPNAGLTVVIGENGTGKTSLLEAIAYLSTGDSLRGAPKDALIRQGAERAVVRAEVRNDGRASLLEADLALGRRDQLWRNRQRVSRLRELLETLRVTVFSPDDLTLVKGGPEERRRYLDEVLLSAQPKYAPVRQAVERVLRQRATLLRQAAGRWSEDVRATLAVWDAQFVEAAEELTRARHALLTGLQEPVADAFRRLTGLEQDLRLRYVSSYEGELHAALVARHDEDLRRATTSVGPHRDDVSIELGTLDARTRLSQGRQRAITLALRLGAHEVVRQSADNPPVLLLDDAFSELDEATAGALVRELPSGQAILTTAGSLPEGLQPGAVFRLRDGILR